MKTLKYILVPVLGGLLFTACNNAPVGPTQAELDTQVEAKVKAATDQLASECNARIMQAAQLQADSMSAKLGNKPAPVATKPKTTTRSTPTPPPPPPVKTNPKADRFDNNGGKKVTTDDTKAKTDRFENGGKKEVTADDTKKKADRFKK